MKPVVLAFATMILAPLGAVAQTSSQPGGVERAPTEAAPPAMLRSLPANPVTTQRPPPAPPGSASTLAAPDAVARPPASPAQTAPAPQLKTAPPPIILK